MAKYKRYLFLLLLVPGFSSCTDRQAEDRDKAKHDKPAETVKARLEDCIYRKDASREQTGDEHRTILNVLRRVEAWDQAHFKASERLHLVIE